MLSLFNAHVHTDCDMGSPGYADTSWGNEVLKVTYISQTGQLGLNIWHRGSTHKLLSKSEGNGAKTAELKQGMFETAW